MAADEKAQPKRLTLTEPLKQKTAAKRKLTPFLAREMLYDYATDQLDPARKAAIDEYLESDKESRTVLDGIRRSLDYASQLSETSIEPSVLQALKESENAISLGKRYSSWSAWPETLRWSLVAILVSTSVAGTVAIVPWHKFKFERAAPANSIEIAQIPVPTSDQLRDMNEGQEPGAAAGEADEGSGDDIPDLPPSQQGKAAQVAKNDSPVEGSGDDEHDHSHATSPTQPAPKKPVQVVQAAAPVVSPPTSEVAGEEDRSADRADKRAGKPKGFVYRAFMTLGELETIGPKIAEQIKELGGEKAGEVELGWKRGTGRYYHFTMPDSSEKQLLEKLQAYGPVRISKDPHPRVMPDGQVRFILWIESAN